MNNIVSDIRERISEGYVPYALSWGKLSEKVDMSPLGVDLLEVDVSDPKNRYFFELYISANGIAFGGKNLAMPEWVGLDCVALPTVSIGFAVPAAQLKQEIRDKYGVSCHFEGLMPVSMYTALPCVGEPSTYTNFSMCSTVPSKGLATYSMVLAVFAYRANKIRSIVQYNNPALRIHSRLGKLKLESTFVPIHTLAQDTFIYSVDVRDKDALLSRVNSFTSDSDVVKSSTILLDPENADQLKAIGDEIVSGTHEYFILNPGLISYSGGMRIPLIQETTSGI